MFQDFIQRFERYLESHGMRLTSGKRIVAECVFESSGSFTGEDLWKLLKSSDQPVGRGTVYRTLGQFTAAGLVIEFRRDGTARYRVVGVD